MSRAYLLGALHDGTVRRWTIRICQREKGYVEFVRDLVREIGYGAWTYREGKDRDLWVVEFSRHLLQGFRIKSRQHVIE